MHWRKAPTGASLGERQKTINFAVNEAFNNGANIELIYDNKQPDVQNMFYIDLACKQKNINFIMNILQSGDDFAITRALNKAEWLCDNEFSNIIYADYLKNTVFPLMSINMRKKLLTKISIHLKDQSRITEFYDFCVKEKFDNIKTKFLVKSTEPHKLEQLEGYKVMPQNKTSIKNLISNSNMAAVSFLESFSQPTEKNKALYALRFMFSKSKEDYLQLLETYYIQDSPEQSNWRFGSRISKNIIKNHKPRIFGNPSLYMNILNTKIITKYSTRNEANVYAASVFPTDAATFWNINFCRTYKYILDLVDEGQRFSFVKRLFYEKYPSEQFEMNIEFYILKWQELLMTDKEKEDWALQHIESGMQLLGLGNDYIWYQFVNFDRALDDVHNLISTATEIEQKIDMLKILILAAKTPLDICKLLSYYDNNHFCSVSTVHAVKVTESFLDEMIKQKQVMTFNDDCWKAMEKLLYKLKVFQSVNNDVANARYRVIALAYYIINDKDIPIIYNDFFKNYLMDFQQLATLGKLENVQDANKIYEYIFNYYCTKIETFNVSTTERKMELNKHVEILLDLMVLYNKTENDLPKNICRVINLEWSNFKYHELFKTRKEFSDKDIQKYLKTDSALVTSNFPKIKEYIEKRFGRIDWVVKKLRTYFSNDIAVIFASKLESCFDEFNLSKTFTTVAVSGLVNLRDYNKNLGLLHKYSPTGSTNHGAVTKNLPKIRDAISKYVYFARPSLPLGLISPYISEEYIHKSWPMMQHYVIYSTPHVCMKFLEFLVEKSFVLQKHGIRLAMDCLDTEGMRAILLIVWNEDTCSATLRAYLYKSILNKFQNADKKTQQEMFNLLIYFNTELKEDDDEIFEEITDTQLANNYMDEFLSSCLRAASKLETGWDSNYYRIMISIIRAIDRNMAVMSEDVLDAITTSHVSKMLDEKLILISYTTSHFIDFVKTTWTLIARNLSNVQTEPLLNKHLHVLKTITTYCTKIWDEVRDGKYVVREFFMNFVKDIESNSFGNNAVDYSYVNLLLKAIIDQLDDSVPECSVYMLVWNLRLSVEAIKILMEPEASDMDEDKDLNQELAVSIIKCMVMFGEAFGTLAKEYMERKKYYPSFADEIKITVGARMIILKSCLDRDNVFDIDLTDMLVYFCKGLLEYEDTEMFMFICKILPADCSELCLAEFKKIIKTIKSFDNKEIQFYLYEKFVNTGFKNLIDTL